MELDFPELELIRLIQQPGWGLSLSEESLIIDTPSKADAVSLLDAIADSLALAAAKLKRISALIRYPYARKPYRIPTTIGTLKMITNNDTTIVPDPDNPLVNGNPLNQKPSEVEVATKLVIEALGGFHWRCDYIKFCEVLGFEPSDYAEEKYSQFQELISNLNKFDLQSITKIVQEGVGTGKK